MRSAYLMALLTTVLVLGCDDPEPPTAPIVDDEIPSTEGSPEADPTEPTPSPAEPEPQGPTPPTAEADEPPPLPTPQANVVHVFVVGEDGDLSVNSAEQELETEPVELNPSDELTVRFPRIRHPNARLSGLLNERVEAFAREGISDEGGLEVRVGCEAPLATPTLVSVVCNKTLYDDREYADPLAPRVLHLAIDEAGVRPVELASFFLPDADILGRVRTVCLEEADQEAICTSTRMPPGVALGNSGINAYYAHDFDPLDFEIPYTELAGQMRANGHLAESLERYHVTTRAIALTEAPPADTVAGPPRWVATPMMSAVDLAAAWGSLPASDRTEVRALGSHLVAQSEAVARRVAALLGHAASQTPVGAEALSLTLVRVARDSDLLAMGDRDAEVVRRLPRGIALVALAPLDEAVARFPRVVAHRGMAGFVDVRRLSSEEVCTPDLEPFLAGFPEAERPSVRAATLRSALSSGSWGRADFITERATTSTVELRRLEAGCQVDRSLLRFTQAGSVAGLQTTRTQRRGGETLVVSHGPTSVFAHSFGHPEALWEHTLSAGDEVRVGQRDEDRWIPIVIAHEGREPVAVEWADGALSVAAAPTP